MKKLFALVLSLALVVAFAVPALASGWAQLDWQIPTYKDISLTLTGLELTKNTSKVGSLYAGLNTYYPVVAGSRVHFYAEVTLPKTSKLSDAMKRLIKDWNLKLEVAVSNIELDKTFVVYTNGAKIGEPDVAAWGATDEGVVVTFEEKHMNASEEVVWGYEFWGTVAKNGKDAVVNATAGFYNRFKSGVMNIDRDMDGINDFIVINNGEAKRLTHLGEGYIVDVCTNGGSNNNYVFFPTKGDKVDKTRPIVIRATSTGEFAITKSVINNPDFLTGNTYANTTEYAALKAVYDKAFKLLGFEYDEANYMTDDHFEHYFGRIMAQEAKIVYPNGSVIVNPANPNLPQTGDNASIVGFAMVVVAMVAAAVVTFKKVRA